MRRIRSYDHPCVILYAYYIGFLRNFNLKSSLLTECLPTTEKRGRRLPPSFDLLGESGLGDLIGICQSRVDGIDDDLLVLVSDDIIAGVGRCRELRDAHGLNGFAGKRAEGSKSTSEK